MATQQGKSSFTSSRGSKKASRMASKLQDTLMESSLSKIQQKLMVMSGKGGVGKSSLSAHLAVDLAARGHRVGLMDVDLHGPSLATMLGIEGLLEITQDRFVIPKMRGDHLKVVSMQSLIKDPDQAVIWRGPAKTGVIRQFIADVQWGELDFLIIDAPPGTGDEPLSVAKSIPGAKALIVTTPQEVALSDVRKSIYFCRIVHLEILGLVENMGPFPCPCCGSLIDPFKSGGGQVTAAQLGIRFLGTLPFDSRVVKACDTGCPLSAGGDSAFSRALDALIETLLETLG
jgi:ATP-binding protein involved in chromosome partitioning